MRTADPESQLVFERLLRMQVCEAVDGQMSMILQW